MEWESFVRQRRGRGDFADLDFPPHPAKWLLQDLKDKGAPVQFSTAPGTTEQVNAAIHRGHCKSTNEFGEFLREELTGYIMKSF
jgi:hypothetical protein